ncbi:MAG: hypothetical protein F6K47_36755 [Symploca sp. SIO2E6]|nr:hypothetical protein [Symploca sp. SIO2E6]
MADYYLRVSGSTKVLQGSFTGFIQATQSDSSDQKFAIVPNSSFKTVQSLNTLYWKYDNELKLDFLVPTGNDGKFKIAFNTTSNDYEVFCLAVNNGTTPITIAGATEFDLQNV